MNILLWEICSLINSTEVKCFTVSSIFFHRYTFFRNTFKCGAIFLAFHLMISILELVLKHLKTVYFIEFKIVVVQRIYIIGIEWVLKV